MRTLLLLLALGACTLIDQRTFNPQAGLPARYEPPAGAAALALVTIDFSRPNPDYAAGLQQAVANAVGRKRDVEFDVVTVVPATGTIAQQADAATGLVPDAREVARAISRDGVEDDRIHLLAQSELGLTTRQVRVFVR